MKIINTLCFSCDNIDNEDLCKLECSCYMCMECLEKFIYNATNGNMVINKIEKSKSFEFDDKSLLIINHYH